jgi:general secretion pathway protein D
VSAGESRPADPFASGVSISAIGAVNITADESNNALVILATVQEYSAIQAALSQLDIAPLQVFLEAAIAEVSLNDDLRYGVQYFFNRGKHQAVLSSGRSPLIGASFPGLAYVFSEGTDIRVVLDALATITDVKVVSSPKLLVLNNQTATLQVGDRVPIVTQQATSIVTTDAPIVNSVQYEDTGVILKVTPRVNGGGMVMMDVSQEVSDVTATTTSAIDSPTIQQRKLSSSVAVQDGETVVLGGLISEGTTRSKAGIPLLQSIPALGNLFRVTGKEASRTELLVFITPHVVDNAEKAREVANELRRKLPALQPLLESANGLGSPKQ